jgi:hypothetical protein
MSDVFAQALHDHHFEEMQGPLVYRRGEETEEVSIEFYFDTVDGNRSWMEPYLDGPLLDMGAGAGRHSLHFQEQFETVAIEQSELLVEVLRDRGVRDARRVNMFNLTQTFAENRFESAIAFGTQVSLCRSVAGLTQFLNDLAYVTTADATAIVDGYDPEKEETKAKLDYYDDPADGLAYRLLQMEYDGEISEPWLYRLFTPDRFRDATRDTDWVVAEERYPTDSLYHLALEKR